MWLENFEFDGFRFDGVTTNYFVENVTEGEDIKEIIVFLMFFTIKKSHITPESKTGSSVTASVLNRGCQNWFKTGYSHDQ